MHCNPDCATHPHCNPRQTHCSSPQTHCISLQPGRCNTKCEMSTSSALNSLQLTATHCNSLQNHHNAGGANTECKNSSSCALNSLQLTAIHCNSLQLTATQVVQHKVRNVFVVCADARSFLEERVRRENVCCVFVRFPQVMWKCILTCA